MEYKNEQEFLKEYDPNKYERPSVTTDIIVLTTSKNYRFLRVLLIKRKNYPFKDQWAIPGGFVNMDEDLETAARRELKEETNVDCAYLEQLYTFGDVGRDPRTRVISVAYLAMVNHKLISMPEANDDAAEAQWFTINIAGEHADLYTLTNVETQEQLKLSELAFDHGKILKTAIERIKGKLEYTTIGFSLLANKFSLSQAQRTYEAILGRPIHASNFRRSIDKMVEKIPGEVIKEEGFKTSDAYKLITNKETKF